MWIWLLWVTGNLELDLKDNKGHFAPWCHHKSNYSERRKKFPFENEIPASLWLLKTTDHGFGWNPVNNLKVYTLTYVDSL